MPAPSKSARLAAVVVAVDPPEPLLRCVDTEWKRDRPKLLLSFAPAGSPVNNLPKKSIK